jgi:CDP-glucose 4,6-dehydratase
LPVTTARAGNCIGGGDWGKDRLIPDCVRSTLKAETIKVRNPRHTRPWQHVLDCLYGYLLMLQEKPLSPWNLVPEEKWTVGELVSNFCVRWEGAKWEIVQEDGPIEQGQIWQKFIRPRNWEPKWGLDKTLDKTVEWYKAYQAGQDMREVCLRQIEQYENG